MRDAGKAMQDALSPQKPEHSMTMDMTGAANHSAGGIPIGKASSFLQQNAEVQAQKDIPEQQYVTLQHGCGEIAYSGGIIYCGEWKEVSVATRSGHIESDRQQHRKLKHGYGEITYPSGASYRGEWREDQICGYGIRTDIYGKKTCGTWQDGVLIKPMSEFATKWKLNSIKSKAEKK